MKTATVVGVVLVVIGIVSLALGSIRYTKKETVLEVGPAKVTADRHEQIPLPPLLGGLALAGGIVLIVVGARR